MDIQIDPSYNTIATLIRYAALLFYNKEKRASFAEKLVKTANKLKFYAYPITLIHNSKDDFVSKSVKPHLIESNSEKYVLEMNQEDSHFIDSIGLSGIEANKEKILKAYQNFYDCGNFDKLIRACYRFLKRILNVNEYDINDNVIRYMVSCICMNDYSNCFNIIENVGQNYVLFDYNIYVFFLYFVNGQYNEASQKIVQIRNNVNEDFYEYVNEKDLAFYFSFCLLYNFSSSSYKKVLSDNDSLVYKLYYKYNEFFTIVDDYYRCDYLKVNSEFNNKLRDKIKKDPFLSGFCEQIEKKFKKKILKEILAFSSEISLETIKNLLVLKKKDDALKMVEELIKYDKVDALIDDIDGVVIMKEKNPINEILEESNKLMEKNLRELIHYSTYKNVSHRLNTKLTHGNNNIRRYTLKEGGEMDNMSFNVGNYYG
jgi:hypothetical protein